MQFKQIKLTILYLYCVSSCVNSLRLNIGNAPWSAENKETGYKVPAIVPGGIYTDLMRSQIIDDVFYGFNDMDTRWVSKLDWNYSTEFLISEEDILKYENIKLVFEGIDTFTTILLNDYNLGGTKNMFVRYDFDVKPYLKIGINTLQVNFRSAVNEAKLLFDKQSENYTVVPLCVPEEYNGECHVNHIRKTQASFSWDWGPALPSMGIWKNVYLDAYNSTVIRDVTINIANNSVDFWDVQLQVYLDANKHNPIKNGAIDCIIHTDTEDFYMQTKNISEEENSNGDFVVTLNGLLNKSLVKLWWPNGYGDANLYLVDVYFNSIDGEQSHKKFNIGFRTVELCQDEVDSGNLFYFKVNGVPIYAKGSNSIPINILPELAQNKDTITFLLKSAQEVHMNMLRVWGGGNYEADIFYEKADEYGILIWQDFMFACNMYPATEDFLSNVKNEVRHQVRRLQHHPSVILWAGNNENEAALRQDWYGTGSNFEQFKADYKKLYIDTIEAELRINDNSRPFLASSPSNGIKSIEEDYVATDPQSQYFGDIHFYNYDKDSWNTETYPIPRFSSEYGYQSLPNVNTLLTATNNISDIHITSQFLQKRQHLPQGFDKMTALLNYRLNLPHQDDENYAQAYIYNSQILQAMAVKIETEFNRQWRSSFNNEGKGYTMGALYWQLNDVWVAPTWSGIDFKGNWKMMQYFSKHFFSPVIITGDIIDNKTLKVYLVSDLTKTIFDAYIKVSIYKWDSLTPMEQYLMRSDIPGSGSQLIFTLHISEYDGGLENYFFYFTVTKDQKTVAPNNFLFPVALKNANVQKSGVLVNAVVEHYDHVQHFEIEVKVVNPALFVWLETDNIKGRFSDNGFLQVEKSKIVYFTPDHPVSITEFKNSLTIKDLTYYTFSPN